MLSKYIESVNEIKSNQAQKVFSTINQLESINDAFQNKKIEGELNFAQSDIFENNPFLMNQDNTENKDQNLNTNNESTKISIDNLKAVFGQINTIIIPKFKGFHYLIY